MPGRSSDLRRTAQAERGEKLPKGVVRLTDGRYRASRQVNGRRRVSPRKDNIAQCLDWLHDDHGTNVKVSQNLNVGEWSDHWLETMRSEPQMRDSASRSETTLRSYEVRLKVYASLRPERLDALTADKVRAVERASGLADSTLHQARIILKAALGRAVNDRLITTSPLDGVASHVSTPKYRTRRLSDADRRKLYQAAKGHRHAALLCTILSVGARQGEARALHWENVRLTGAHGQIDIRYTAQQVQHKGTMIKVGGRTKASTRDNLNLDTTSTRLLRELHDEQGRPTSGPVFPSPGGEIFYCEACQQQHPRVISAGTVEAAFRALTLQTGIRTEGQRLGSHIAGRHSLASSEAFRRDPATAAAFLGHDVRTYLGTYVHSDNADNQIAAEIGDALFGGSDSQGVVGPEIPNL